MDTAIQLCLPYLSHSKNSMLCLDENTLGSIASLPEGCKIISNRFDVAAAIPGARFSDWKIEADQLDCLAFRLSKEKAVNHHIINQAISALSNGGTLVFSGQKNQGIKSYAKSVKKLLGNCDIEKHGLDYLCTATINNKPNELLDDQNYSQLRPTLEFQGFELQSKPGQFGWNKLDQGSLLLLEAIQSEFEQNAVKRVLDLGCGYGFLSVGMALQQQPEYLCASDNNAAAIASCLANLKNLQDNQQAKLEYDVIPDDCARNIDQRFDTVVCNPPFHQGFDVENQLTDKFLESAKTHLSEGGRAYFVVNSFIGIEKKAKAYFKQIDCLENNKQFKILRFQ
ncbi:class I SAM-dependent methyltransferase [Pseudoteredinibacter isoporae]|uniref:16S rRNA (Guanine1207-N2)-methyltransferase n=1 Tax=Pseudoteredinibacter isoporae TaxID=570281 RepID=A0A7X0MZI8_9GAMM|nr:methyltransferase [Pseudoteredinibacter isoporae]MBB6523202.1 16S rRNA (guanine1207-N2)-methyltransferase [Pseudoteredinibacter isoporae]NHO88720.1 class I SAM-dependent methyltransferase [Pseudoteredinibacter isoporae]NIB22589.1 class I SAM-dependent methyltransferase [Pseudoteredinibacter isoporae]